MEHKNILDYLHLLNNQIDKMAEAIKKLQEENKELKEQNERLLNELRDYE